MTYIAHPFKFDLRHKVSASMTSVGVDYYSMAKRIFIFLNISHNDFVLSNKRGILQILMSVLLKLILSCNKSCKNQ